MIVGTGAIRTEDSVMFAKAAKAAGADALVGCDAPLRLPTGREIALHALAIDRAANLPVMLYNYPGRMSVNMDEETLDGLVARPISARSRKARATSTGCICWRAITRISRCPVGWMIRRLSSLLGVRGLGLCRIKLRSRGTYRTVSGLRRRGGFHQRPGDHVRDAAADAGARAGRQVRAEHQIRPDPAWH